MAGATGRISGAYNADAATGPIIVSSDGAAYPVKRPTAPGKAAGRAKSPKPTRYRPDFSFTTDIGPTVSIPGGHYVKCEFQSPSVAEKALKLLYKQVS